MGEFQKRIDNIPETSMIEDAFEITAKVKMIIGAAEKEFPKWDNTDIESRLTRDVLLDLVKAKDKWFKKWFDEDGKVQSNP